MVRIKENLNLDEMKMTRHHKKCSGWIQLTVSTVVGNKGLGWDLHGKQG